MSESNKSLISIGFWELLGIVLITLKLTGTIAWSWFWVLLPLWIPFAILLFVLLCIRAVAIVVTLAER